MKKQNNEQKSPNFTGSTMHIDPKRNRIETLEAIIERLRADLKRDGLKNSKQREAIISVLYKSGQHLSPDDITLRLKAKDKNTSISSVYRILGFLEKEGFVTSLESDKSGKKYEIAAKSHHDHIVCLECGNIIEFVDLDIERLQIDIANQFGAQLISHDMRLFVKCAKCVEKER